mgnify:CR=1 FL=1
MEEIIINFEGKEIARMSRDEVMHFIATVYEHSDVMEGGHIIHRIMCEGCANLAAKFQEILGTMDSGKG